jgi:hypothetical protein
MPVRSIHLQTFCRGYTQEWKPALVLLSTMVEAIVKAYTTSYSAANSAWEKGQEWQLALGLLSTVIRAEANVIFGYFMNRRQFGSGGEILPSLTSIEPRRQ